MNAIYKTLGISKQNFHQRLNRQMNKEMEKEQLLVIVNKIRQDHPMMSARMMHQQIKPEYIGRDRFEEMCFASGYKLKQRRNKQRTTNSLGVSRFENALKNRAINGINQALVSDITYYRIKDRFYYLTFIMDLYSRRVIGYGVSEDLLTENTTIPALKMAIKNRNGYDISGIIIHSDGGGQYYSKQFLKLTRAYKMQNSMGENVYENAHAERLNGTIKNDYLYHYQPDSLNKLKIMLKKAVDKYNTERPHLALNVLTPAAFETALEFSTKKDLLTKRKKVAKKEKVNINNY